MTINLKNTVVSLIFLFSFQAFGSSYPSFISGQGELIDFQEARQFLTKKLQYVEAYRAFSNWDDLIEDIRFLKKKYALIDRLKENPASLLAAQFELRFYNSKLKSILEERLQSKHLSLKMLKKIEGEAQIFNEYRSRDYNSPRLTPPVGGVTGVNFPLSEWAKEKDYYNYTFIGDEVLFRGLRLKSGDLFFNHNSDKPSGMFTAVAENPTVFSHVAILVILKEKWGRLPLVMDAYERGIRFIPLHHFLSPHVMNYGEVFRLKNPPADLETQTEKIIRRLVKEVHPYDLIGREERVALSCAELIPYFLELLGQEKVSLKDQINENIYKNILKFGFFERTYIMPNDILQDGRFEYIGYFDNSPPLRVIIANDIIIDLFREKMTYKVVKNEKGMMRKLTELTINKIRDRNSKLGQLLRYKDGFTIENFPVGDVGLLSAVYELDIIFGKAMRKCIEFDRSRENNYCYDLVNDLTLQRIKEEEFSITYWRNQTLLRNVINMELDLFNELFE